jgi:hypothetical protein
MNIYLIPYTAARFIVVSLITAGAALMAWWVTLYAVVVLGPYAHSMGLVWHQAMDGAALLANISCAVAFTSVFVEGSLRRRPAIYRFGYACLAAFLAFLMTLLAFGFWFLINPYLGTAAMRPLLADSSLVSLRYRIVPWAFAGMASGVGPLVARVLQEVLARRLGFGSDGVTSRPPTWSEWMALASQHVAGGLVAGTLCAAIWHSFGHYSALAGDLYLGPALGAFTWGLMHGLLVWAIPDDMYAGWIRVLSPERYGLRIPVPHRDGTPSERFLGHFPRGLDLYLPAENGVAELHVSFVVNDRHQYAVRGLSVQPTVVKRFLARVDLHYDPHRPAPLETDLQMEDRVLIGVNQATEVEFLMLPKEER